TYAVADERVVDDARRAGDDRQTFLCPRPSGAVVGWHTNSGRPASGARARLGATAPGGGTTPRAKGAGCATARCHDTHWDCRARAQILNRPLEVARNRGR